MKISNLWQKLRGINASTADTNFFLKEISGLIHVGANIGDERKTYAKYGLDVVWVEPIQEIFENLKKSLAAYPQQKALQYLVTDCDDIEYPFYVSSNDGASSSILEPKMHKEVWPHVTFQNTLKLKSITFKSMVERESIALENYQALVLDTQGSELLILKGAKELLKNFSFIKTEAADFESYAGCCTLDQLSSYLAEFGFRELMRKPFKSKEEVGTYYDVLFSSK